MIDSDQPTGAPSARTTRMPNASFISVPPFSLVTTAS